MATLLQVMQAEAQARTNKLVEIANPSQPAMVLLCRLPADGTRVEGLHARAKAADKGKALGTNFARALLAEQTREVQWAGETVDVEGRDPEAGFFADAAVRESLGATSPADAVYRLVCNDGDISTMALSLMSQAGYGSATDPLD